MAAIQSTKSEDPAHQGGETEVHHNDWVAGANRDGSTLRGELCGKAIQAGVGRYISSRIDMFFTQQGSVARRARSVV